MDEAERLLAVGEEALVERLGLGMAALGLVSISQPSNGCCVFGVVIAMFLASQADVTLSYWDGIGILAHLITECSEVVSTLCSRRGRPL